MLLAAATHGKRVQTQCSVLLCIPRGKKCHRTKSTPASPSSSLPPPTTQSFRMHLSPAHTAVHLGAEADYISVGFLKVCDASPWRGCDWNVVLLVWVVRWGVLSGGWCAELVRAERFLRCNLLRPDERAAHNGPSPAHQASVEQVCSLEGDYNGFSADPARSFATAHLPIPHLTSQTYRSGARPAALCFLLFLIHL